MERRQVGRTMLLHAACFARILNSSQSKVLNATTKGQASKQRALQGSRVVWHSVYPLSSGSSCFIRTFTVSSLLGMLSLPRQVLTWYNEIFFSQLPQSTNRNLRVKEGRYLAGIQVAALVLVRIFKYLSQVIQCHG